MKATIATFLLLMTWLASAAHAVPKYEIVSLGLDDLEHTRNDGYRYSVTDQLNEAGQVVGHSNRYNGSNTLQGYSAWLYDGATTIDLGYTGPEHTRNDGFKLTSASNLNEAGQVIGYSERYNGGSTSLGFSAWLYDGTTTIALGLTDAGHTSSNGVKYHVPRALNEAGQVVGSSDRYNGNTFLGLSAWLYDGATTIDIGLTGPEHTDGSGLKDSFPRALNETGQIIGYSARYNDGSTYLGQSVWRYDGAATNKIGLTGPDYTRSDGYKYSDTLYGGSELFNEAGQVAGHSERYSGSNDLGSTAWLYDGATTIDIGLAGPEYIRNDGFRASIPSALNEMGQVIGYAVRYNGSTDIGRRVWLFDGATTIAIGLTGPDQTGSGGFQYNFPTALNEAGQVIGGAIRYENGGLAAFGLSAWLYNGATTIDVGLNDIEHTRDDGYKLGVVSALNAVGQAIGYSTRYNGGSADLGVDAWWYDPVLDQTIPLRLSTHSNGYAHSTVSYFGDDGLVLGTYELFDALDNYVGERAYYFTPVDGLHDLGSLVVGGLSANGWDFLADEVRANSQGQILGHGKLTTQSGGQMAYLLTPVPEPSALLLAALGAIAFLTRRRF